MSSSSPLVSIGILQVLTILVGLLRSKGLSVLLGPAHFGVASTIDQVVMTVVQLGALSLPFTAMKFISRGHSEGQEPFERSSATFLRAMAVLAAVTTLVASAALAWRPGIFGADLARYQFVIQVALLGIPAVMLNMFFVNTLAAAQRPIAAAGLNLLVVLGLALAAIVGVKLRGLAGLYVATGILGFSALVGSVAYLRRTLGLRLTGERISVTRELKKNPQIMSYSAYVYVAMSTYGVSLLAIRYTVLSRLGEAPAGMLQVSLSIALTVGAVLNTMSNLYLTPLVNRQLPVADKVHAANDFAKQVLGLLLLGALPIVLFPRTIVGLLYTPAFAAATSTVFLFVVWQCVYQLANVYQQLLIGLDDVLFTSIGITIGYGMASALSLVTVPRFGLGGAAMALAAGMVVYGGMAAIRLRVRHATGVSASVFARGFAVAAIVIVAGRLFGAGLGEISLRGLAFRTSFGVASLGLFWLLLTTSERELVFAAPGSVMRILRPGAPVERPDSKRPTPPEGI